MEKWLLGAYFVNVVSITSKHISYEKSKRNFFIFTAAAVVLAFCSCSKAEIVENENQLSPALKTTARMGTMTWFFENPDSIPENAKNKITAAMNEAVANYNAVGSFNKIIRVIYNPKVATADANNNGPLRFGANALYMKVETAQHELAHCYGVGTSVRWKELVVNGKYTGEKGLAMLRSFDGNSSVLHADRSHFWPYGLNKQSDYNEVSKKRNPQIVWAMIQDGLK